jgi:pimeloyl-ACP methyl ester carboxylesterase
MSTSGFAEINGGRLYYEKAGSGHPLVLVHGMALDTRMWDDQFDLFARHFTVIRYNVRGFGKDAAAPSEPYTHAADLKALLAFLGVEHAYVLGLSLGGAISLEFALNYPQATDALVLLDSVLWGLDFDSGGDPARSPWKLGRTEGIQAAKAAWLEDPMFQHAVKKPHLAARLRDMTNDCTGWVWREPDPGIFPDPPTSARLGEITAPTLVLVGDLDVTYFQEAANTLVREIPGAKKVVIEGAGHMSNMENPEAVNKEVLIFLQGLEERG